MVFVVIAFASQRGLFEEPLQAWGDSAINGLSVLRAEHLQQLVGNYSRVGFHHPGPAYMYLLASGEVLFFHVLHVVPAPYNGQLLAVSAYVSAALAAVCLIVFRSTRSLPATALTFAICLAFGTHQPLFGQDWFPFLYVSAFLLLCVAGAATATGRTAEWPFVMIAAAFLAHGHASFLMFSGATLLAVLLAWWLAHRGRARGELRRHPVAVWASVGVAALACLPVVIDFVVHFPGEWPDYLKFTLHGERAPRTTGDVLRFVGESWTDSGMPVPWPTYVVAALAGASLLALDGRRGRRRAFLVVYAVLVLESLLYLYYIARGVDHLSPVSTYIYVGFFYRAVPVTLLVTVATQLCLFLAERLPGPRGRLVATGSGIVLALVLGVLALWSGHLDRQPPSGRSYTEAATTLARLNSGPDRPIVLQNDTGVVWPTTAAIALELTRMNVGWCTQGPNASAVMYGEERMCTAAQSRHGMLVAVTNRPLPRRHRAVWQDHPDDPRIAPGTISLYLPRR